MIRLCSRFATSAAVLFVCLFPALAQAEWPERPVRFIVPYAAGGGSDFTGRIVADALSRNLGVNFVVENMPGANAALGLQGLKRSDPDGYTVALSPDSPLVINPSLMKDLPYEPLTDFTPITMIARAPLVLVANPSAVELSDYTMDGLLAAARENPGKIRYGTAGIGNMTHLAMEMLSASTGTEFQHLPYPGVGPSAAGLLAGDVQIGFFSPQTVAGQVEAGELKVLGVSEPPAGYSGDVATFDESGLPDYDAYVWVGLLAPAGLPDDIKNRLYQAMDEILHEQETIDALASGGWIVKTMEPDDFAEQITEESAVWKQIIEKADIHM